MNKLVYVLALGVTGIALTVATTVTADTTGSFVDGTTTSQQVALTDANTDVTTTIAGVTDNNASIEIIGTDDAVLGTVDTTTEVTANDTTVTGGTATLEADLTPQA